ncbi:hypothetical protein FLA4_12350 [Candidatus Rickettsia kotlanii]|nr:hypothetical protein FLA4_12350 [Candidatus Rickettsia kotlanii]BDU62067.1 hypothetical protein HM2_12350 [Candidatus Rickettsia kotlanii]
MTYDKDMSSRASSDAAMSLIEGYRQLDDAMFADSDNIAVCSSKEDLKLYYKVYCYILDYGR